MSTRFQPGTIVNVLHPLAENRIRGIVRPRRSADGALEVAYASGGFDMLDAILRDGADVRRVLALEVVDPERTVADLTAAIEACGNSHVSLRLRYIRDEIAAQTQPPEPQGLGAVVEDTDGISWVRVDGDDFPWFAPASRDFVSYQGIDVARVLSEGVQP